MRRIFWLAPPPGWATMDLSTEEWVMNSMAADHLLEWQMAQVGWFVVVENPSGLEVPWRMS